MMFIEKGNGLGERMKGKKRIENAKNTHKNDIRLFLILFE
jgi:hypothetical protein